MVVALFVAAAEAVLKGTPSAAVKDAYLMLKDQMGIWAPSEVEAVRRDQTPRVGAPLAEVIDARGADDQAGTSFGPASD